MNRFNFVFLVGLTLFLSQSCSFSSQTQSQSMMHENHDVEGKEHEHHGETNIQAKLTISPKVLANQPTDLVIDVRDAAENIIADFEVFQEKLMHLIVVSDNLDIFQHLHPEYKGKGRFELKTDFPQPGNYTMFADYKPVGQAEQVSVLKTSVIGNQPTVVKSIDFTTQKVFGNTKVKLDIDKSIKAGEETMIQFDFQDATSDRPVQDLQPYLGEKGHLVIVKQEDSLNKSNYIHSHALQDTPANRVHFVTQFPQSGTYKIWGQFNRNGKIITADFWLNVRL